MKSDSKMKSESKMKLDLKCETWVTKCSKINPDPTQEIEGYVAREVFYIIKLRLVQV